MPPPSLLIRGRKKRTGFFQKGVDYSAFLWYNTDCSIKYAGVMELADVLDSKSSGSDTVSVRPRSPAPKKREELAPLSFLVPLVNGSEPCTKFALRICVKVLTPNLSKGSTPLDKLHRHLWSIRGNRLPSFLVPPINGSQSITKFACETSFCKIFSNIFTNSKNCDIIIMPNKTK